ncbi:MAG: helical backbone metal receptor [bacterium]|nr:helical backbone metal receptor [bacterium]
MDGWIGDELGIDIDPASLKRVISLVPSLTETLFDLNLGDRLVGRTDYCIYPADKVGKIPTFGGTKNPDIAGIIAQKPDLVLMNREENRLEDATALQEAGIRIWATFPKTVPDVFNLLWNIMDTFQETSMVARVRLIEYSYDWVSAISQAKDDGGEVCKIFVPIWKDPWMTFNADTYTHDLLRICGGTNVFAERERQFPLKADLGQSDPYPVDDPRLQGRDVRYPRITLDEVVAMQPDVVLLPSEPYAFTQADIAIFANLDIPAAKNKRIHLVDGSYLTWHGTRIAYAMNELPPLIFPNG